MRLYIPHAMRAVSVGFAYFVAQRYPHSHLHLPFAMWHVPCAMRLPPFAIPPSRLQLLQWVVARLLSLRFSALFGFAVCACATFAAVAAVVVVIISTHLPLLFTFICLRFVHVIRSLALTFRWRHRNKS